MKMYGLCLSVNVMELEDYAGVQRILGNEWIPTAKILERKDLFWRCTNNEGK